MSEQKSVEAVSSSESSARLRLSEAASSTTRTQDGPPSEPVATAPPVEPSPAFRPYRVLLDPETRRLVTEVIDTRTGNVLLRIPPGYVSADEIADAGGMVQRREVEL